MYEPDWPEIASWDGVPGELKVLGEVAGVPGVPGELAGVPGVPGELAKEPVGVSNKLIMKKK